MGIMASPGFEDLRLSYSFCGLEIAILFSGSGFGDSISSRHPFPARVQGLGDKHRLKAQSAHTCDELLSILGLPWHDSG